MVDTGIRILELLVTLLVAILGSAGFWSIANRKRSDRDLTRRLLIGLAHDRIVYLCLRYIQRGSITQDEYENLAVFLYRPYIDIGGNGSVMRLMTEVDKLPIAPISSLQSDSIKDLKGKDHVHGQQNV